MFHCPPSRDIWEWRVIIRISKVILEKLIPLLHEDDIAEHVMKTVNLHMVNIERWVPDNQSKERRQDDSLMET